MAFIKKICLRKVKEKKDLEIKQFDIKKAANIWKIILKNI